MDDFVESSTSKVSVVMPAYNVADFIGEMLDSLMAQTLSDIEVICVDDGSTDSTALIIKDYTIRDSRIKLISKENGGAATARNIGLELATGESVIFVDADDMLLPTMLEELYSALKQGDADISVCETQKLNHKDGTVVPRFNFPYSLEQRTYFANEVDDNLFQIFRSSPTNKLFDSLFLAKNNINFQNLKNNNDVFFVCANLALASKIAVVKKPLYIYRTGYGNSTQDTKWKYPLCQIDAAEALFDYLNNKEISSALRKSLLNRCWELCLKGLELAIWYHNDEDEAYNRACILTKKWNLDQLCFKDFMKKSQAFRYWCLKHSNKENFMWAYAFKVPNLRGPRPLKYKISLFTRLLISVMRSTVKVG